MQSKNGHGNAIIFHSTRSTLESPRPLTCTYDVFGFFISLQLSVLTPVTTSRVRTEVIVWRTATHSSVTVGPDTPGPTVASVRIALGLLPRFSVYFLMLFLRNKSIFLHDSVFYHQVNFKIRFFLYCIYRNLYQRRERYMYYVTFFSFSDFYHYLRPVQRGYGPAPPPLLLSALLQLQRTLGKSPRQTPGPLS